MPKKVFFLFCFLFSVTLFSNEILISTNQDNNGDFQPMEKTNSSSYLASPSSVELSKPKVEIRKIKGNKLRVIVAGSLRCSIATRNMGDTVELDAYANNGEWLETKQVPGTFISLQIEFKKFGFIKDEILETGFQKMAVRHLGDGNGLVGQYGGNYKFMYYIPADKVEDKDKLLVDVKVSRRLGKTSSKTDKTRISEGDDSSDGETTDWQNLSIDDINH